MGDHKASESRVSGLMEIGMPSDLLEAHERTDDGQPWLRWIRSGEYSGWMSAGTRKPRSDNFWTRVFAMCCEEGNGRMDAVHAVGPALLSVGAMGLTATSGMAQALLHACFLAAPDRYVRVMIPVLHTVGVYVGETEEGAPAFFLHMFGHEPCSRVDSHQKLQAIISCASDGKRWLGPQKERAKTWVSCCSRLLRDARFDSVQIEFAKHALPGLIEDAWPRLRYQGPNGVWGSTPEHQAFLAVVFSLALWDPEATSYLVRLGEESDPYDASRALQEFMEKASAASVHDYVARAQRFRARARELFL